MRQLLVSVFLFTMYLPSTITGLAQSASQAQSPSPSVPPPPGYSSTEWDAVKKSQLDALKFSKDSPSAPKNPGTKEGLCNQPTFGPRTEWSRWWTPRWERPSTLVLGSETDFFDMSEGGCMPKSYDVYVPNETPVKLMVWRDAGAKCNALETYADNPTKDYGSIFTTEFTQSALSNIGLGLTSLTFLGKGVVQEDPNRASITLPASGVRNTAATVTLSCHSDDEEIEVGVQQKVVIHYGSIDLFSGSTGTIVSTLGKKIYGVKTTDTGTKNADGTPVTASTIAVTSSSNAQFVPLALIDLNWAGNERNNLNVQFGLGVNPNGSSTQVEYFLSPLVFATHHVYLAPGIHIAQSERVGGGFTADEVVPSGFSVPLSWKTVFKFGFTVSFKPYK